MAQEAANKTRSKTPPRVGYFLRCYPRFSQTFVVNEILELERQGLDIDILSQRRPADGIFHDSVCRVRAKTDYLPETIIGNVGKFRRALRSCCRKNPRGFRTALAAKLRTRGVSSLELCRALGEEARHQEYSRSLRHRRSDRGLALGDDGRTELQPHAARV